MITSGCATFEPWAAAVGGIIGGLSVLPSSLFILHVLKVDDPVDAVTVRRSSFRFWLLAFRLSSLHLSSVSPCSLCVCNLFSLCLWPVAVIASCFLAYLLGQGTLGYEPAAVRYRCFQPGLVKASVHFAFNILCSSTQLVLCVYSSPLLLLCLLERRHSPEAEFNSDQYKRKNVNVMYM